MDAQILHFRPTSGYDLDHMDTSATRELPFELQTLLPEELWSQCVWHASMKGERLFSAGRKPDRMYYVASGEVILQRLSAHGENLVLQRARQSFVAEASLHTESYHCDAVVTVSGELVAIPVSQVRQALINDPSFAMRWIAMLNRELKRMRAQSERLSLKGVRARLLHLIESEGQLGRLPLGAGLKSIALELGVTHEALYRTVAQLEKQGVLKREDGMLCIL